MKIEAEDVAPLHLAGLWHRGPYERIRESFAMLFPRLEALDLDQLPDAPLVAVYYDDPQVTAADELRSFAAVRIAAGFPAGDLDEVRVPGGRFLRAELIGRHDQIPWAWTKLSEHLAEGGYTSRVPDAPSFEVYVRPGRGSPAGEDRTDLFWPIT